MTEKPSLKTETPSPWDLFDHPFSVHLDHLDSLIYFLKSEGAGSYEIYGMDGDEFSLIVYAQHDPRLPGRAGSVTCQVKRSKVSRDKLLELLKALEMYPKLMTITRKKNSANALRAYLDLQG